CVTLLFACRSLPNRRGRLVRSQKHHVVSSCAKCSPVRCPRCSRHKRYELIGKNPNPSTYRRRTMKREHPALVLGHSGHSLNSAANWLSEALERHKGAVLAIFSIAYFALTFYRASRKLFWLDELFTVYLSRLPDFKSVWHVLLNGVDFNPPVLYLLT